MKKLFFISVVILTACSHTTCEENRKTYFDQSGSFRIASIWETNRETNLYDKLGKRIIFESSVFIIQPEVGDSIYKEKGTSTYIFVKKDSCYAQDYDCNADFGRGNLLIIKRWKNGDTVDIKQVIP